jgi:hypothetical protein
MAGNHLTAKHKTGNCQQAERARLRDRHRALGQAVLHQPAESHFAGKIKVVVQIVTDRRNWRSAGVTNRPHPQAVSPVHPPPWHSRDLFHVLAELSSFFRDFLKGRAARQVTLWRY